MSEWCEITLVIMGGVITILTLWNMIEDRVKKTKAPADTLTERVALIERKLEFEIRAQFAEYDARFGRDKQKIESLEEGNKIIQKSMLALLEHSIDGNNTDGLLKAKKELSEYLINR